MRVVLYGSRPDGHAKACLAAIEELPEWSCAGLLDDFTANQGNELHGLRVLGGRERLATLTDEGIQGIVLAFGRGRARFQLLTTAVEAGLEAPALIHPAASMAPSSRTDQGAVVLRGALVGDDCHIEAAGLVNMGAVLTHDVRVGPGATVGPGSVLAGRCIVGAGAKVGAGATLLPDTKVGDDAVVGAGAVVRDNVLPGTTVAGVPARALSRIDEP